MCIWWARRASIKTEVLCNVPGGGMCAWPRGTTSAGAHVDTNTIRFMEYCLLKKSSGGMLEILSGYGCTGAWSFPTHFPHIQPHLLNYLLLPSFSPPLKDLLWIR